MNVNEKPKYKGRLKFVILCSLIVCCYFFRHTILIYSFDLFLKRQVAQYFSQPLSYENIRWEGNKIVITGLTISDDYVHLNVDKFEVDWKIFWTDLYFEPHFEFIHPEITLIPQEENTFFPFAALVPDKYMGIKVNVQNGVLQLNTPQTQERLYFSFKGGQNRENLGNFYLSHDPHFHALPITEMNFTMHEEEILASLKIGQMDSARLLHLVSFFYPNFREGWESIQGEVEVMVSGSFRPDFSFSRVAGMIDAQNIYLSNSLLGIHAQVNALHGEFTYPPHEEILPAAPFWKQIRASATVEEGDWVLGTSGLKGINAHLLLDPSIDPLLDLTAMWIQGENEVPIVIQGRGSIHPDQRFWLEMGVKMTPIDGENSDALISICSSEKKSYVAQIEMKHLDVTILEMLSSDSIGMKGTLEGKITGWFENQKLTKIQIDDFQAKEIEWPLARFDTVLYADLVQGEALFLNENNKWEISSLQGSIPQGVLQSKDFCFPVLNAAFSGQKSMITTHLTQDSQTAEIHYDLYKREGWLRCDKISEESLNSLLQKFQSDVHIEGVFSVFGTFNLNKIFFSIQGMNILIDHPLATFHMEKTVHPALLNYNFNDKKWQGSWSVVNSNVIAKEQNLHFENISTILELHGSRIEAKELHAVSDDLEFRGNLNADLEQNSICLSTSFLEGSLTALFNLLDQKIPISGQLIAKEEGFSLFLQEGLFNWQLKAELKEIQLGLKEEILIRNGSCFLSYDSNQPELSLKEIDATLLFKKKSYKLTGQAKKKEWWEFDIYAYQNEKEVGRAVGLAQERPPAELHFAFEKNKTHFLGVKPSITRLIIQDWTDLLALEMHPTFNAEWMTTHLSFFKDLNLISFDSIPTVLEGEINTHFFYEDELAFEGNSSLLKINGENWINSSFKGKKKNNVWILENISAQGFNLDATVIDEEDHLNCKAINLHSEYLDLAVEGDYDFQTSCFGGRILGIKFNKGDLSGEGEGDFLYQLDKGTLEVYLSIFLQNSLFEIHSKGITKIGYTPEIGWWCDYSDFHIQKKDEEVSANCHVEHFLLEKDKWVGSKLHIQAMPEFLFSKASNFATWFPKNGTMDVEYIPSKALLKINCCTSLENNPLYLQLQMDHSSSVLGMLKITDHPKNPGIKAFFKSKLDQEKKLNFWDVESIQGEIKGLEVNFYKNAQHALWGSVCINAGFLHKYLPKDIQTWLKKVELDSSLQLEGSFDWNLVEFKGGLKAKDVHLLGYKFQELQSAVFFSQEKWIFENLTLDDPAGHFLIKHALVSSNNEWTCHIPLILINEFQPSRMQKTLSEQQTIKPLVIKKLSIYDVNGFINDLSSFTARGKLNFTNTFRKEFSILEIPLEMIKNLGLDLGLFTPTYGEAEFQLKEGKFILTDLLNTYSEGKRSEFYLPDNSMSYLDIQGNLSFDFKMKQSVLLNITEPFTLTVRGSLSKPKYSLVW